MQLIKIEKYLDTPTTSCDSSSNVHDCYFLVPEKLKSYFNGISDGLIDVKTRKKYEFPIRDGREFRLTQFSQYINDKKITMGDQIIIYILRNNNDGLSFYIDVEYKDFFLQVNQNDNIYKLYVSDEFQNLFLETNKIELPLENEKVITIEKSGNEFIIDGVDKKKFILEKDDELYKVVNLERAKSTEIDASLIEDVVQGLEYNSENIVDSEELKKLFSEYIDNSHLAENSKKIGTRINYLEKILPELLDENNPKSIFEIKSIDKLYEIKNKLSLDKQLKEINNSPRYSGQILQTMKLYLEFFKTIEQKEVKPNIEVFAPKEVHIDTTDFNEDNYVNFLKLLSFEEDLKPKDIKNNILFNIGQPNTGKSYKFEEINLFDKDKVGKYKYLKIPVSGGIGNEYKGLQNTDLAITYDPIKEELRFGEFLQMLMSAIVNPKVPHVVFLDDFHNQDISSLLSEYTPLFKGQQKRKVEDIEPNNAIYNHDFNNVNEFIEIWNGFIESHCSNIPIVPLTNRISGASLKLVYPSNFYLLGAANFNENSLNIFADWEDRAVINYIDPIESFTKEDETNKFLQCCKKINNELKELLQKKNIFDYEKYCFGIWKIVDKDGNIVADEGEQKKLIDFFFSMIKNSLKHNNKNSEINNIGWELIVKMQNNDWFKTNIEDMEDKTEIDYKILHKHNIYEDEI